MKFCPLPSHSGPGNPWIPLYGYLAISECIISKHTGPLVELPQWLSDNGAWAIMREMTK